MTVAQLAPKMTFIPWGSGIAIKRAGSIVAIIPKDELPELILQALQALGE